MTTSMSPMRPAVVATEMDFPTAIQAVLDGQKVRRHEWPDDGSCVYMAAFDEDYLVIRKADHTLHALTLRGVDLRATDWIVLREN